MKSKMKILIWLGLGISVWHLLHAEFNYEQGIRIFSIFFDQISFKRFSHKLMTVLMPSALVGYPKVIHIKAPELLNGAREFKHGSVADVLKNYNNSLLSSCPPKRVPTETCMCYEIYEGAVSTFSVENQVQSVVVINKKYKQIVVSFRPSLHLYNFIDDLNYLQVTPNYAPEEVKVHRGFLEGYLLIRDQTMTNAVEKLKDPRYIKYTLHITGYSLGAAIATISIVDWHNLLIKMHDKRKLQLMTYSSPRVGNAAFVDYIYSLNIPVTRFTVKNDLVPHVPPRNLGYTHVGAEVYEDFPESKDSPPLLKECSQAWDEDPNCSFKNYKNLSPITHLRPLGRSIQTPPYC